MGEVHLEGALGEGLQCEPFDGALRGLIRISIPGT